MLSLSSPSSGVLNVYVEQGLLPSIQDSMVTYVEDLSAEGYSVSVQEFSGAAADLRATLASEWTTNELEGALFIGDLPYVEFAWEDYHPDGTPFLYYLPHDLYFMDLDGEYVFYPPGPDGRPLMKDVHLDGSGDVGPEIYVSRITTGNLSGVTGKDEVTLINEYFSKVHDYRSGVLQYQDRGIVFRDDDWAGLNFNMDDLYTEVDYVTDETETTVARYLDILQEDYESILQCIHSSPTHLGVEGVGGGTITNADIQSTNPRQGFYNLFSCASADFRVNDHLIGTYVYGGDYGLNAIGPTRSGGMMGGFSDYYAPQRAGDSVGQAFMQWLDRYVVPTNDTQNPGWVFWFYPMTMQGDPTLAPASMGSGVYLIIDANDPGGNGMDNGTPDDFRVALNGANLEVYIDTNLYESIPLANVLSITVNGSSDDDTLTVDLAGGNPIPTGGLTFDGGSEWPLGDSMTISGGPQPNSFFGHAVAADGELTVVGCPYADIGGVADVGAAYVFNSTTGELLAALENPTPAEDDQFGYSVALSGSTVVVGTPDADYSSTTDTGAAYVFDATTGDRIATLLRPTPEDYAKLGYSVAISGSTVVVGAIGDNTGWDDAGAAYVFDVSAFDVSAPGDPEPEHRLENRTPAEDDYFGWSVAISGSTVVVGTPHADYSNTTDAGAAYVFDATTGGNPTHTLVRPTPEDYAKLGYSVAISGSTVVAGALGDNTGADDAGAAYVFDVSAPGDPAPEHTLVNPTPAEDDYFGYSVALSGRNVVVGTPFADYSSTDNAGGAYVFDATTGGDPTHTLVRPTPEGWAKFGHSVAVSGDTVVVGAPGDDIGAHDAGAAYVFNVSAPADPALEHTLENPTRPTPGYAADTVVHTFTDPHSGQINIDGKTITYSELESDFEPMFEDVSAVNRVFNFGPAGDNVTVSDAGVPGNGISRISIPGGQTLDFSNPSNSLTLRPGDVLTFDATLQDFDNTLIVDVAGSAEMTGAIGGVLGLTKTGPGTLTLSGEHLYTGATNVNDGRLDLDGAIGLGSTVTVASGATLGGWGCAGGELNVQGGGTVAPGLSPGILDTVDLNLADDSTFEVEIGGTTPGLHDQLIVWFSVTIGNNVTLSLSAWRGFVPSLGDEFVLIDNEYYYAVAGTFAGLAEGAIVSTDFFPTSQTARITYAGGDGNDVAIVASERQPFVVSTRDDEDDADYSSDDLSLREALGQAAINPGRDVIVFSPELAGETINLALGELQIRSDLDLVGCGVTIDALGNSRVLRVFPSETTIRDLTVTGGDMDYGGGIYNAADLRMVNCKISGNKAFQGARQGGGIYSDDNGLLSLINSTISGNLAGVDAGGIFNQGTLWVVDSTISGNWAGVDGGGIGNFGGEVHVANSTLSINSCRWSGGGIINWQGGTLTVVNSTIVDNTADTNNDGDGGGGGIRTPDGNATTLHNTIVADNHRRTDVDQADDDLVGLVVDTSSHNLVSHSDTAGGLTDGNLGNIVGQDPLLAELADNGGSTQTHALLPGSPAIDKGDDARAVDPQTEPLWTDQRGLARFVDGDGDGIARVDIGAFEYLASAILRRQIFYNNSAFDGNDPAASDQDDAAIGVDKSPLLPAGTATFANYTSFSRGINGIMVDVANLPDGLTPTAEDFELKVGNSDDPAGWAEAPDPASITVRTGEGVEGSDRITLVWPDNVIQKQWLQVTIPAGGNLGLDEPDVFYYGNAVGESGNSTTDAKVNAYDMLGARDNQRTFINPAEIDFAYDYNRDARVNAYDMLIARDNQTHFLNALKLITVPGGKAGENVAKLENRLESWPGGDGVLMQAAGRRSQVRGASPWELDWLCEFEQTDVTRPDSEEGRTKDNLPIWHTY